MMQRSSILVATSVAAMILGVTTPRVVAQQPNTVIVSEQYYAGLTLTGPQTTTRNGNTTIVEKRLHGKTSDLTVDVTETTLTIRDDAGKISIERTTRSESRTIDNSATGKPNQTFTSTTALMKEYHAEGVTGYQQTLDVTDTASDRPDDVYSSHEVAQYDTDDRRVSGEKTTTTKVSGNKEERRYHYDGEQQIWVADQPSSLTPAHPETVSTSDEQVYAPPVSGASGEILVTYHDREHPNGSLLYVGVQRRDGSVQYYRAEADDSHQVVLNVDPDATKLTFFKGFDASGTPDAQAATTIISSTATVPGTEAVLPARSSSSAIITGASPTYNQSDGTITVQTEGSSAGDVLEVDNTPMLTLAASDRSIVARISTSMALGRHALRLQTLDAAAQVIPFDEIALYADPIDPVENVGDRAEPTIHVEGLAPGDRAVVDFRIGGSAQLEHGGSTTTVPVEGGVARCSIVGVRQGRAVVRYHLRVTLARANSGA